MQSSKWSRSLLLQSSRRRLSVRQEYVCCCIGCAIACRVYKSRFCGISRIVEASLIEMGMRMIATMKFQQETTNCASVEMSSADDIDTQNNYPDVCICFTNASEYGRFSQLLTRVNALRNIPKMYMPSRSSDIARNPALAPSSSALTMSHWNELRRSK